MKGYRLAGAFVVAAFILTACPRVGDLPVDPVRVLSGTVANWEDRGTANVRAAVMEEEEGQLEVVADIGAEGQIAANGSFEVVLPEAPDPDALAEETPEDICEGEWQGAITPESWRSAFATLVVSQDGEDIGEIALASRQEIADFMELQEGDFFAARVYMDRPVTVQGTCIEGDEEFGTFTFEADAVFQQGWNILVWEITGVTEGFPTAGRARTVATPPANAQWFFWTFEELQAPPEGELQSQGLEPRLFR